MNISSLRSLGAALLVAGALTSTASADLIVAWDAGNAGSSQTNPEPNPWDQDDNLVASKMTMHGTIVGASSASSLQYKGWSLTFNLDNYVGFTVQPKAGYSMTLTDLFYIGTAYGGSAGSGQGSYSWGYRIDGGAWTLRGEQNFDGNNSLETWTFDQPITTTGVVEFGFFAKAGIPNEQMTPTINSPGRNDIQVNGTMATVAVPEPSTYALIGIASVGALVLYVRKRRLA